MSKCYVILSLVILSLFVISCGEDGDTGPQGPQGPAGSANVQTKIFRNQPVVFNKLAGAYVVDVSVPEITNDVMATGAVSAFVAPPNSNNSEWTAVPGNYTPDFGVVPTIYFDFQYSSSNAIIYSLTAPSFTNVDLKLVIAREN